MAASVKPVIHRVDPQKNTFTDITHDFGDISKLTVAQLAQKMADYAKSKGVDGATIVNEFAP